MIAHLNEVRKFMKELSPELAVSDPVSEDIVAYIAECIQIIEVANNFNQSNKIQKVEL